MKRLWDEWYRDSAMLGWGVAGMYAANRVLEGGGWLEWVAAGLCFTLVVVAAVQRKR